MELSFVFTLLFSSSLPLVFASSCLVLSCPPLLSSPVYSSLGDDDGDDADDAVCCCLGVSWQRRNKGGRGREGGSEGGRGRRGGRKREQEKRTENRQRKDPEEGLEELCRQMSRVRAQKPRSPIPEKKNSPGCCRRRRKSPSKDSGGRDRESSSCMSSNGTRAAGERCCTDGRPCGGGIR